MKFVKQHRLLSLLLAVAILTGGWFAWYSHPRTLEELAPGFRWEEINEAYLLFYTASCPRTDPPKVGRRELSLPGHIDLPMEDMVPWQEASFQRLYWETWEKQHGILKGIPLNREENVYFYQIQLTTEKGHLSLQVDDDRLLVEWSSRDGRSNRGPWVVTYPDGLLTATGEAFLPYATEEEVRY